MLLDVLPLAGGGARLVRVYSEQPCLALPAALAAPGGGVLRLTELGDYCFSQSPRSLPPDEALCRYRAGDSGQNARLLSAPGSAKGPAGLPAVCGPLLESLALPSGLRVIGSCAFYNCRRLRALSFGSGELTVGSDVFLNCFELATLTLRSEPGEVTGLFALVNNIAENVCALFGPENAAEPRACFWYPAYWEDIEETPAHILLHTFSGQGYHYRQCFSNARVLPAEYDAIFPEGHDADDAAVMAQLCFGRLRWPWQLSAGAAASYRAFLAANVSLVLQKIIPAQDTPALRALLALDVMDEAAFSAGAAIAARASEAEAAALLAAAARSKQAAKPKKARYDFDF